MGQAKQRGTREQRIALAEARNQMLETQLKPDSQMGKFQREFGTQRLATRLVACGALERPVWIEKPIAPA